MCEHAVTALNSNVILLELDYTCDHIFATRLVILGLRIIVAVENLMRAMLHSPFCVSQHLLHYIPFSPGHFGEENAAAAHCCSLVKYG